MTTPEPPIVSEVRRLAAQVVAINVHRENRLAELRAVVKMAWDGGAGVSKAELARITDYHVNTIDDWCRQGGN